MVLIRDTYTLAFFKLYNQIGLDWLGLGMPMFMYPPHLMCHQDIFQKYQLTNWQKNRCNAVGNLHSFAAATMVLLTVPEYSFKCIKGVRRAAWECRSRFRDERWNCPDLFDQLQIHLVKSKSIFSTGTSSIYVINCSTYYNCSNKEGRLCECHHCCKYKTLSFIGMSKGWDTNEWMHIWK